MAISLYELSVESYARTLGGVAGFLEKGVVHFRETGIDPQTVVETRLYPDMQPFQFQIQSIAHHSIGAIEGLKQGVFGPPPQISSLNYADLQALVADARAALGKVTPTEVNALSGKDIMFKGMTFSVPFTAEGFLLSFSLPNFYFHAATAYDILRMKGVPLGKRDFLSKMRIKS